MPKPDFIGGYDARVTANCERVLVTLLRGLGPWKDSVYLIGGLAPRYLVRARPPKVPQHAGTGDVDIVVDLAILADVEAYRTLENNLRGMGFERAQNEAGQKQAWRWQVTTDDGTLIILEFLADDPAAKKAAAQELPTGGNVTALNIPHAAMVADLHDSKEVTAELLGENGIATEIVKYANLVSFTCLKAFAFDQRNARKDAHDLVYCLENAEGGFDHVLAEFRNAMSGPHAAVIVAALARLAARFGDGNDVEGYRRDGPVAVARFELGYLDGNEIDRNSLLLRQRQASDIVMRLVHAMQDYRAA